MVVGGVASLSLVVVGRSGAIGVLVGVEVI